MKTRRYYEQASKRRGVYLGGKEGYVRACFLNNKPDATIIQIYSVIKLYMFRASSLHIIRSFLLYIQHW